MERSSSVRLSPNAASVQIELDRPLGEWAASVPENLVALASRLLHDAEAQAIPESEQTFTLPNTAVAAWSQSLAVQAGLPQDCPFGLDMRLSSGLGQKGAKITPRWLRPGSAMPLSQQPEISGVVISLGSHRFRLQEPYFSTLGLIQDFNQAGNEDPQEQFRLWARIRETFGDKNIDGVTETFLRAFRVAVADAFTFSFTTDAHGHVQVIPVLLASGQEQTDLPQQTKVRALTEADEEVFCRRLDDLPEGASAFPLSNGTYVVVDERLQKALQAVRRLRRAAPEERKRAVLHPEAVIAELLGEETDAANPVFIETEKYSERVLDVAEWMPPVVPWIKIPSQSWVAPNSYGFRIGDAEIALDAENLDEAIRQVDEAIAAGRAHVEIRGQKVAADAITSKALHSLKEAIGRRLRERNESAHETADNVLVIHTNFEEGEFARVKVRPRPGNAELPDCLKTSPKEHQLQGLSWLQAHWREGSTGALLADDMGLGKTFQALAFLGWVRQLMLAGIVPRRPILIVAPVGLLRNWEAEHDLHLVHPGLGDVLRAYGEHLKFLKRGSHRAGTAALDSARLANADWIVTNYETLSDYQLTFGAIRFAVAVFDEAQKIKSPSARMTHASKALNAEFVLTMTGTPIENRLADFWCIADTAQPGALGDLRSFSSTYEREGSAQEMMRLRSSVWHDADKPDGPALLMLRRLKTEKLKGLPVKHEHFLRRHMPPRQAQAYQRAIALKDIGGPGGTLGIIQALRAVSLHPCLQDGGGIDSALPEDSARFILMLEILDQVSSKGEKALVFIESLDLQAADQLPLFLKRRYGMPSLPMVINGEVSTAERQARVDMFQHRAGFDVMLLSPKAGGVGLTLTAANHVIHLSRWWNPAVEDQCSDRVYRIGQTREVHVYYPMAIFPDDEEHSFDLRLDELMRRKRQLSQQMLAPAAFTKQDYEELMKNVLA